MKVKLEMDYALSKETTHTSSFKFAEGIKFNEKTKISAGVEGVASGTCALNHVF